MRTFLNSLLAGFRRSLRLCRRRFYTTTQLPGHTRCPSNCSTLNIPYEEVVRYQRHPQDAHRLIALLGANMCADMSTVYFLFNNTVKP